MNHALLSSCLLFACILGLAPSSDAQSLVRISGLGGRELRFGMQPLAISSDGTRLLVSAQDGLFVGDANGFLDVTWFDTRTGVHQLAFAAAGGTAPDGSSTHAVLSANERYLACTTEAANILPGDSNGLFDVYLLDQQTGVTTRASLASNGSEPAGECTGRGVSNDGRFVVFTSDDDGLVSGDGNGSYDVFVRDMVANTTQLISVNLIGQSGNGYSDASAISADGRYVLFNSGASDLVASDANNFQDVFLRDRQLATTTRVSVSSTGVEGDQDSFESCMTPDARWIAFASQASNLAPGVNGVGSVYLLDRASGQVINASRSTSGLASDGSCGSPTLSPDGRYIAFQSSAANLDPADTDAGKIDNFLRDLQLGVTRIVSVATDGGQGTSPSSGIQIANVPMPSADGSRVLFNANIVALVAGDTNDESDAFLWDANSNCPAITAYCTGKLNSQGCVPAVSSSGEPHLGGPSDAFFLSASSMVPNQLAVFIWSGLPNAAPFFGGTLCLSGAIRRTPAQSSGGGPTGCTGSCSYHFTRAYMAGWGLPAGQPVFGQFWSRDGGFPPPNNVSLTDAITFTIWP